VFSCTFASKDMRKSKGRVRVKAMPVALAKHRRTRDNESGRGCKIWLESAITAFVYYCVLKFFLHKAIYFVSF